MSSDDLALRVRDLGKRYWITPRGARPGTLAEAALRALRPGPREPFWANRHVSFEVRRGEVVGLIGHNGAGKSTLLKLLSRIVEPTEGTIDLYGRVGSLLEVGSGFHPELTGRENIHLNGAILGLTRREIADAFDEIVAFFGYPGFLETPVKRYSSGMYVRLAFAVAAHLRSEILIVDEVLAVGDAEFQKRCLGKMHDVARSGRTVFFVSHNLAAVTALCTRAILLRGGQIHADGSVEAVVGAYQKLARAGASESGGLAHATHAGTGEARCLAVRIADDADLVYAGSDLTVEVEIEASAPVDGLEVRVTLSDPNSYRLVEASSAAGRLWLTLAAGERRTVRFVLRELLLRPGLYTLGLWLGRPAMEPTDAIEHAAVVDLALDPANAASALLPAGPYDIRYEVSGA